MIAIVFALPQESGGLVASLRNPIRTGPAALPVIYGWLGLREVVVCHIGMGAVAARAGLQRFWQTQGRRPIDCVIGAGFAGGLDPSLSARALLLAENSPELLAAARAVLGDRARVGLLASVPEVAETPESKARLARETGAAAVDMETATVAAFFREKGVPFLALRVISDAANDTIPVPGSVWFDAAAQRPRPLALLWFLIRHPSRVFPFVRFVASIYRARRVLTQALLDLLVAAPFSAAHAAAGPVPRRR